MIYLRHRETGYVHGYPVDSASDLSSAVQAVYESTPATVEDFNADQAAFAARLPKPSWGESLARVTGRNDKGLLVEVTGGPTPKGFTPIDPEEFDKLTADPSNDNNGDDKPKTNNGQGNN